MTEVDSGGSGSPRLSPLDQWHRDQGAKIVPFAGYLLPVQYRSGVLAEHKHTRTRASLFDVSHMGQLSLTGSDVPRWLESLVPGDIEGLADGQMRYSVFTNAAGGIIDDLMVTRTPSGLGLVVNAARKSVDIAHLQSQLPPDVSLLELHHRALLALQGPKARAVLGGMAPQVARLGFLRWMEAEIAGIECGVSCCGYTGEDGFEISVSAEQASELATVLLEHPEVAPAGLGARDSLRLEAGLPLHGQDIHEGTTPVEASLAWVVGRSRRLGPRAGGFPGADRILAEIRDGPPRRRVGLLPEGRAPFRAGVILMAGEEQVGEVTSGTFSPTLDRPVAMAYIASAVSKSAQTEIHGLLRGRPAPVQVAKLPFVGPNYYRGEG